MSQRITDLTISVLACVVSTFLSWPFWRNYEYWAESHAAWWIYFAVGFLLALYVFYVFIGSLRILFIHDTQEQTTTTTNKDRLS